MKLDNASRAERTQSLNSEVHALLRTDPVGSSGCLNLLTRPVEEFSRDTELRFWSKVGRSTAGCWLWRGSVGNKGYGYFAVGRSMRRAHRVMWELARGAPGRLHVLHRCDNPPCVNPDHLFLGTNRDNIADMVTKGRHRVGDQKPGAKLTAIIVREIRLRLVAGASQASLAREFGVSKTTLNSLALGRKWRHVEAA